MYSERVYRFEVIGLILTNLLKYLVFLKINSTFGKIEIKIANFKDNLTLLRV